MMTRFYILLGMALISLTGCTQLWIEDDPKNTYPENFEVIWNTLDQRYTFFDYKNIDWDSVRTVYQPLAASSKTDEEFFDHMASMLNTLRDGHVNLRSQFDVSRYLPYLNAPANYSFDVLERNYLGNYRITGFYSTRRLKVSATSTTVVLSIPSWIQNSTRSSIDLPNFLGSSLIFATMVEETQKTDSKWRGV